MTGIPVKQLKDKDGNAIQPNSPDKVGYASTTQTMLSWGVDNPINEDGWIRWGFSTKDGTQYGHIIINGIVVNTTTSYTSQTIIMEGMHPVKKGDSVKGEGTATGNWISFYPNRTNLENGGGSLTP